MQKLPNQLPTSYSTSKSRTCVSLKKKQIKARKWAWWARISHISVRQVLTWRFHKWAWPFMTPLTSPFVTRSSLLFVSLSVNCFAADSLWQRARTQNATLESLLDGQLVKLRLTVDEGTESSETRQNKLSIERHFDSPEAMQITRRSTRSLNIPLGQLPGHFNFWWLFS